MKWHNAITPKEEIEQGDMIELPVGNAYRTALVFEAPSKYYWAKDKWSWKIGLDINGIEYAALWSPRQQMWLCEEN